MRKVRFKVIEELKEKEKQEYRDILKILLMIEIQQDINKILKKSLDLNKDK